MNLRTVVFIFFIGIIFLAGCVPTSVNPLYLKKDLIVDQELIGTWGNPLNLEGTRLVFTQADSNSYSMAYYESRQESGMPESFAEFDAHLIRLGGNLFLDVFPEELENLTDFYKLHFVPTHSILRIEIAGDTLKIGLFDFDWLEDNLDSGKVEVKHEYREGQIILTASTEDLQKFVSKYADVAFPYDKDYELMRLY